MTEPQNLREQYWKRNLKMLITLLIIWFVV